MKPLPLGITLFLTMVGGALPLTAQQNYVPEPLTATASQNPTDMYLEALSLVTQAAELEKTRDYVGAIRMVQEAERKFAQLAKSHPTYQANLLQRRRQLNRDKMAEWQKLAQEQARNAPTQSEFNIEKPSPVKPNKKPKPNIQLPPGYEGVEFPDKKGDPLINRMPPLISNEAVESNYERMRQQLNKLSGENKALIRALKRTTKDKEDALTKLALAAAGESHYRDELVKVKKQLQEERSTNNKLLKTLTARVEELENGLQLLQEEKAQHLALIAQLRKQSDEQKKELDKITAQRDALQKERDQLATIVELNSPEKTKSLLDRNMTLTAQLKAALDKIAQLETANSDSEEQRKNNLKTLEATRNEVVDLKLKLMALQDENTGYRKRITDLNTKLINADIELSKLDAKPEGESPLLKAENELLRSTIAKQLRILSVRDQSRSLLISTYKRLHLKDPEMAKIAELMDNEEAIRLTPAEQQIVNAIAKENAVDAPLSEEQKGKIDAMAKELSAQRDKADKLAQELETLRKEKAGDKHKKALAEAQQAAEEQRRQVEELKKQMETMKANFEEQARLDAIAKNNISEEQRKAIEAGLRDTTFKKLEVEALGQGAAEAFAKKRYAAAEQLYLTLLDLHPNHVPALVNLGTILLQSNKAQEAIVHLQKATVLDAKSAPAWFIMGVAQYRAGLDRQASESLTKTVHLDPANSTALLYLGNIETSSGNHHKAVDYFERAIKITPNSSDAHYNLAWTFTRMGKLKQARKSYDEAIRQGGLPDSELEMVITGGATTLPSPVTPVSKEHEAVAVSNPDAIPAGPNEIPAELAENPNAAQVTTVTHTPEKAQKPSAKPTNVVTTATPKKEQTPSVEAKKPTAKEKVKEEKKKEEAPPRRSRFRIGR